MSKRIRSVLLVVLATGTLLLSGSIANAAIPGPAFQRGRGRAAAFMVLPVGAHGLVITTAPAFRTSPRSFDPELERQAILAESAAAQAQINGDLTEALAKYGEARDLFHRAGDPAREASCIDSIAAIYERQGDYEQALQTRNEALAVARAGSAHVAEAIVLKGISQVNYRLGRYIPARDLAQQALTIARDEEAQASASDDSTHFSDAESAEDVALNALALADEGLGDYTGALAASQRRLSIARSRQARAQGGDDTVTLLAARLDEEQALNGIGNVYGDIGQLSRALDYFQQALAIARELGDDDGVAVYQNNIAFVYEAQGRLDDALALFQTVLSQVRQAGDRAEERVVLDNIGNVYGDRGDQTQALTYFRQSLGIAQTLGNRAGEATSQNNIGVAQLEQRDYAGAVQAFDAALAIARNIGERPLELTVLDNQGRLYEAQDRPEMALAAYNAAIAVAEDIRTLAHLDEFRTSLAESTASIYQHAAALLVQLGRNEAAFDIAERGRARTFLDRVGGGRVDLGSHGDPALISAEQQLREQISRLDLDVRHQLSLPLRQQQQDSDLIAQLQRQLSASETQYGEVLTRLQVTDPETASLVSVSPLDLHGVQSSLEPDTTLLSYYVLPAKTLAFIVTKTGLQVFQLPVGRASLEATNKELRAFASPRDAAVPAGWQRLYGWLIAPLASGLATQKLIVIPHGVLNYIPFSALYDGQHYFDEQHTLSYLPSASALPIILAKQKGVAGTPLVMALQNVPGRQPLPSAVAEAQAVAISLATEPILDEQATLNTFMDRAPSASVIHLATHGELDETSPLFSRIFLGADADNNGVLTVQAVYQLKLAAAPLVVLSACETNLGALSTGDELVGLTRGFIYAGSRAVIASLWNVNDKPTAMLMTAFYGYLTQGRSAAQALQAAQSDTRKVFPNPYYWAPFVLTGV